MPCRHAKRQQPEHIFAMRLEYRCNVRIFSLSNDLVFNIHSQPQLVMSSFWAFVLSTCPMIGSGRTLQIAKDILSAKGLELPHHVAFQADNTCREMRNSWTFLWSSWLISHGVMRTVDEFYYKVGHTHNECDQRFWVISSTLSRETTLQSPQDYSSKPERTCNMSAV